jgi:hypothetical protein
MTGEDDRTVLFKEKNETYGAFQGKERNLCAILGRRQNPVIELTKSLMNSNNGEQHTFFFDSTE